MFAVLSSSRPGPAFFPPGSLRSVLLAALLAGCAPTGDSGSGKADVDQDGDGAVSSADCDDADPDVHPGATEVCDGVDDDCDGTSGVGTTDAPTWYADGDGDGHGDADLSVAACTVPDGYVADATDCDDARADVFPGAVEVCNGIDDDCDGTTDTGAADSPTWFGDADQDGYGGLYLGSSTVTLERVTLSSVTLERATVSGNTLQHKYHLGYGSAVSAGRIVVDSSTVSSNDGGSRIGALWGSGTCTSSTFTSNAGCDYGECSYGGDLSACATGTVSF